VSSLPPGRPVDVSYADLQEDAYVQERTVRSVWATKHSETDVTVFSPICPHLGCRYAWQPQNRRFVCPCHGSVFAPDGRVLAGPAPRPLDTLPGRVEKGELLVEWERFEVGVPEKIVV
jgi:menaquinol-cytochrome c reductase iron-sulfur subunit